MNYDIIEDLFRQIEFNFNTTECVRLVEKYVAPDFRETTAVAGGYFIANQDTSKRQKMDIYIVAGEQNLATEAYLDSMLNEEFKTHHNDTGSFDSECLAHNDFVARKVFPCGVVAEKEFDDVIIHFTSIDFKQSDMHIKQLLNTFDLELCKIAFIYIKDKQNRDGAGKVYLGDWFNNGGSIFSKKKNINRSFFDRYKTQKKIDGKILETYKPETRKISVNINDYIARQKTASENGDDGERKPKISRQE